MLTDARIRLEGRLEAFEHTIATLRAAVEQARRGDFRPLAQVQELPCDEAPIARLVEEEPELRVILAERIRLQTEAARLVRARALALQHPEQSTRLMLATLVGEPVVYEGLARSPFAGLLPLAIGLLVALEVAWVRHPAPLILHGAVVVFLAISAWRVPTLRVTSRRVFIGAHVLELSDLRHVAIDRPLERSATPYRFTATLRSGAPFTTRLAYVPREFCDSLRAAHVEVTRRGFW
jgi:hypothetical protein